MFTGRKLWLWQYGLALIDDSTDEFGLIGFTETDASGLNFCLEEFKEGWASLVENVPVAFGPEILKEGCASLDGNLPVAFGPEMLKEGWANLVGNLPVALNGCLYGFIAWGIGLCGGNDGLTEILLHDLEITDVNGPLVVINAGDDSIRQASFVVDGFSKHVLFFGSGFNPHILLKTKKRIIKTHSHSW